MRRSWLAVAVLAAIAGHPAMAGTHSAHPSFLIVNPSGRGNQGLAQGFLGDFARAIRSSWPEGAGPPPAIEGRYHVTATDALASIKRSPPVFALLSPGFYLEHRDDLHLEVLLQPARSEKGPN